MFSRGRGKSSRHAITAGVRTNIEQRVVAPDIVTERLILRAHRSTDLADCAAMWSDRRVVAFISGQPSSLQQTWSRLLGYAGHWALMGFGYWAVQERASGAFVGELGFADYKRAIEPSIAGVPELGWAVTPAMQNKGYATEALRAVVMWGDRHFTGARTICIIDPHNAASIRVATKCGYREWLKTSYNGAEITIFSRAAHQADTNARAD